MSVADADRIYRRYTPHDPPLPAGVLVPDDTVEVYYHWTLRQHIAATPTGQIPIT